MCIVAFKVRREPDGCLLIEEAMIARKRMESVLRAKGFIVLHAASVEEASYFSLEYPARIVPVGRH